MNTTEKKVYVGMSGGVDSSVAALLLRDAGYDVTGVFMRCYNIDGCAKRDAEDARRVAERLDIPFYVWDFEEEYKQKVVEYMVEGYKRGITPNPDVMCNKEIKFGLFLEKALSLGADYVATGHYVRVGHSLDVPAQGVSGPTAKSCPSQEHRASLFTARDSNKDQSYFLWTLTQRQLKHCLFPVGDYLKSEVREMAKFAELSTAEKKDSQGICFLGDVKLTDFLSDYIERHRGDIVTTEGKKVGEHDGAEFFTIGQRRLGSGLRSESDNQKPLFVTEKNVETNTIVVGEGDNEELYKKEIKLRDVNFINPITNYQLPITIFSRIRYRQKLIKANLSYLSPKTYNLEFDQPVKFPASGQSAVVYSEDGEVLGGGIII